MVLIFQILNFLKSKMESIRILHYTTIASCTQPPQNSDAISIGFWCVSSILIRFWFLVRFRFDSFWSNSRTIQPQILIRFHYDYDTNTILMRLRDDFDVILIRFRWRSYPIVIRFKRSSNSVAILVWLLCDTNTILMRLWHDSNAIRIRFWYDSNAGQTQFESDFDAILIPFQCDFQTFEKWGNRDV